LARVAAGGDYQPQRQSARKGPTLGLVGDVAGTCRVRRRRSSRPRIHRRAVPGHGRLAGLVACEATGTWQQSPVASDGIPTSRWPPESTASDRPTALPPANGARVLQPNPSRPFRFDSHLRVSRRRPIRQRESHSSHAGRNESIASGEISAGITEVLPVAQDKRELACAAAGWRRESARMKIHAVVGHDLSNLVAILIHKNTLRWLQNLQQHQAANSVNGVSSHHSTGRSGSLAKGHQER